MIDQKTKVSVVPSRRRAVHYALSVFDSGYSDGTGVLGAMVAFHIAGAAVHLLLLVGLVFFLIHFVREYRG